MALGSEIFTQILNEKYVQLAIKLLLVPILALLSYICYNLYLHPLASFPGPRGHAATRIPYVRSLLSGRLAYDLRDLHEKYGDVVRTAPGELSFIHPQAFKDIYGLRPGHQQFPKDHLFYTREFNKAGDIIRSNDQEHARFRRLLAHSFSEKSLRAQEPLVQDYTQLFVDKLRNLAINGQAVNMTQWFNFITFDLIGDLAFGEPFGCLKTSTLHPWIQLLFNGQKAVTFIQATRYFPIFTRFLRLFVPKSFIADRVRHYQLSKEKMDRRIANKDIRDSDFLTKAIDSTGTGEKAMTVEELRATANVLVLAGSETTATTLTGICYYLLKNPECLEKLRAEIDEAFKSEDEMNAVSIGQLKYLAAVINEGLRVYPPVPANLPRRTPPGGETINGQFIPEGVIVYVSHLTAFTNSHNFAQPLEFIPERWLGDPRFQSDRREVLQPFSMGPRNCIGKNLASMEMKLILTRLLWNFNMELQGDSAEWAKSQRSYVLWEKGDLNVKLTPRRRE
ncbi:cytochrome P450 [Xylogone sp. PMI_703]|nr:cytochrome P450 [Xylogone sp. PMI_703]